MNHEWREDASCLGVEPSPFFPLHMGDQMVEAKRLCQRCPVREECHEDALRLRDVYGYRGGMSGEARRALLAKQNQAHTAKAIARLELDSILRLHGKRWSAASIAQRLGVDATAVYRVLKAHREAAA